MDTNTKRIEGPVELPKITPETSPASTVETGVVLSETEREQLRSEVLSGIAQEKQIPVVAGTPATVLATAHIEKSEMRQRIEAVLEEDLRDTYFKMEPGLQAKFKREGEHAAEKIEDLLAHGKATAHRVFKLILVWLKLIPGMNKFFIKQEAKIKTDRIMNIKK